MGSEINTQDLKNVALPSIKREEKGGSVVDKYMALNPNTGPDLLIESTIHMFWGSDLAANSVCLG